ncbi:Lyrm4 [Columba guinea]|nr:Lyrm4 [Columba guinea]
MAASSRAQVLRLYRALLRESQRFSSYNYRTYAVRRIRDAFRENKHIKDSEKIEELVNKAKANLEVIHRQDAVDLSISHLSSLIAEYRLHDILRCQKTDSLLSYDIPIFSILVRLNSCRPNYGKSAEMDPKNGLSFLALPQDIVALQAAL